MGNLPYAPPRKRSVLIAGHQTSVSLEPIYWTALEAEARRRDCSLNALIAAVDSERLDSRPTPNLTSALRQFLLVNAAKQRLGE